MRVCLTPQQRNFLFSVSVASAHDGNWQGPCTNPKPLLAVSLAMLTFRDGSCLQCFCSIDQRRMEQAVGVTPCQGLHRGLAEPTRAQEGKLPVALQPWAGPCRDPVGHC